jgi:uncharacterized protein (DUF433 family)
MNNPVIIPINYIERKPNSHKYRIVGKGVTVEFLSRLIDDPEWPMERICTNYHLTPSEVYAAWAFYFDHKDEIDRNLNETQQGDTQDDSQLHERLTKRYQEKTGRQYPSDE